MTDYKSILAKCGWSCDREKPPLIAERVARYAAERIEKLEAYKEKCEALVRYTQNKNDNGAEAVITEIFLLVNLPKPPEVDDDNSQ